MKMREFGRDRVQVSEVGLGTWQLGSDWGNVTDSEAFNILEESLEEGITFYDTADVYGPEISERRLGGFFAGRLHEVFIATKLGRFPDPGWPGNFSYENMRAHTEASLRRLGAETLDLTQLHCIPHEVMAEGAVFDHLRRLKGEGKIRRFGASVESMDEALLCLEEEDLYSLQIIFNVFRQKPLEALFNEAKRRGVALIVRLPLASGLLAGKFSRTTTFPETDHRSYNRDGEAFNVGETFSGLPFAVGVSLADRIKEWVPAGASMAQMALRWVLDFDQVGVVIPGATSQGQVSANAAASDMPNLGEALHARLREFYHQEVEQHIRGPY